MIRFWLFFLGAIVFLSACVTNKKYVYLQKDDLNKRDVRHDTVVRAYVVDSFVYKVQPNDLLSIRVKSLTEKDFDFFSDGNASAQSNFNLAQGSGLLAGELVDNEGSILFAGVGKIKVAGLTVFQVQDTLQKVANKFFDAPVVKVRLLNYRFTILGEVMHEGTVTLLNNRATMLEAIGHAGGLGELADRSNIKLIRQHGNAVEVQYIDLLDENFINSPYYYVNQNDVLVVSPLKQRPFRRYFGQNLAVFVSSISILLLALNLIK